MIVKIGSKFYDGTNQPIMVILSDEEKDLIHRSELNSFCSYPSEGYSEEAIKEFMTEDETGVCQIDDILYHYLFCEGDGERKTNDKDGERKTNDKDNV